MFPQNSRKPKPHPCPLSQKERGTLTLPTRYAVARAANERASVQIDIAAETEPFLTAAICTLDRASALETARALVEQATAAGGIEILLVNNGSSETIRPSVPAGLHYVHEPAPGLSLARNAAVAAARGRFILFVDDDIVAPPGYLAAVVETLKVRDPDILGGPVHPVLSAAKPRWLSPERLDRLKSRTSGWTPEGSVSGGNFAVRRSLFEEMGGFRADLGMVGARLGFLEEYEFVLRYRAWAGRTGAGIYYAHDCAVGHASPAEKMRFSYLAARAWKSHAERGRLYSALAPGRRRLAFRLSSAAIAVSATTAGLAAAVLRRSGHARALSDWALDAVGRFGQLAGALAGGARAASPKSGRRLQVAVGEAAAASGEGVPLRISIANGKPEALAATRADFWAYDRIAFDRMPDLRTLARLALEFPRAEIEAPATGPIGSLLSALGFVSPAPEAGAGAQTRLSH